MSHGAGRWLGGAVVLLALLAACERTPPATETAKSTAPASAAPPNAPPPRRDPLVGGPYPALFLTVAQFTDVKQTNGKTMPVPGAAKLLIARKTESGWKVTTLEDPASNAFHKAMPWEGGLLTI